jgi:hypothetical protein
MASGNAFSSGYHLSVLSKRHGTVLLMGFVVVPAFIILFQSGSHPVDVGVLFEVKPVLPIL